MPAPARLLLVLPLALRASLDGLFVRNARRQQHDVDVVLPLHPFHDHLDVHAADARDEELLGLGIEVVVDGRVFFRDARERGGDLVFVASRLRLDGERDRRLGELDARELEEMRFVTQRVARGRLLQLGHDADLAGPERVHRLDILPLHPRDVAHPLLAASARVDEVGVGLHRPAVDAEERQLADVRIGEGLEDERGDGRLAIRLPRSGLLGLEVSAGDLGAVSRRGKLVDDEIEQRRAADAFGRRGAEHRDDLALADAGAQRLQHLGLFERALLQILVEQLVVRLGGGLHELLAILLHAVRELRGHRPFHRLAVSAVRDGLLRDEIHESLEAVLLAHGQVQRDETALQATRERFERAIEVGALTIEAIDDDRARQIVVVGELPDFLRLDLHARHRVDDDQRRLDDTQPGARVRDEVAVPRRVHEVDPVALPLAVREGRVDRDLALDLVGVEVGGRRPVVDLAETVDRARGEEHRLDERRLAHSPMADDADVPDLADLDRHSRPPADERLGGKC